MAKHETRNSWKAELPKRINHYTPEKPTIVD